MKIAVLMPKKVPKRDWNFQLDCLVDRACCCSQLLVAEVLWLVQAPSLVQEIEDLVEILDVMLGLAL
jgi:hypothetical protein